MKKSVQLAFYIFLINSMSVIAQIPPDSVLKKYHKTDDSDTKITILWSYLNSIDNNESLFFQKYSGLIRFFNERKDDGGVDRTRLSAAMITSAKKEYDKVLDIILPAFPSFKSRKDTIGLKYAIDQISTAYNETENHIEAIKYKKELIPIYLSRKNKQGLSASYNWIGSAYAEAQMPDSGLMYAHMSENIDHQLKNNIHLTETLATLAENYIVKGDYDIGLAHLRKLIILKDILLKTQDSNHITVNTWPFNDFAQAFLSKKLYDSSIDYAHRSLDCSIPLKDLKQQLRSYNYLYRNFDALGKSDSSCKYFRLASDLRDSFLHTQKIKAIEASKFRTELQQMELNEKQKTEEELRKKNIRFILTALGILILCTLTILLCHTPFINGKNVSFLATLILLVVVEFINLLFHSFIDRATHHNPMIMLVFLVAFAFFIIPLHHRIENWSKKKLYIANKKIRRAFVRKINKESREDDSLTPKEG